MELKDISISEIDKSEAKIIYSFFKKTRFKCEVRETKYRDSFSRNSYFFVSNKKDKCDSLIDIFNINNKDLFKEKFKMSTKGKGHEISRILTVHSSALCPLLCFYNLSKNNTIEYEIEKGKKCIFDESYFEWENTCTKNGGPSSVDVVLVGYFKNEPDKKVIFFLESKFSEYLKPGVCHPRSEYLNYDLIYNKDFFRNLDLVFDDSLDFYWEKNHKYQGFTIGKNGDGVYSEGIKQIISHYIGVVNLLNGDNKKANKWEEINHCKDAHIYLGEILFDFGPSSSNYLKSYKDKYGRLAIELNKLKFNIKNYNAPFKVLSNVLIYQELYSGKNKNSLDDEVINFYNF